MDNRTFWKTVKPLFSEKVQTSSDITLVENRVLVSHDLKVAKIVNDYLVNITDTLGISNNAENLSPVIEDNGVDINPVSKAIRNIDLIRVFKE